jgi:hypothetical protein
MARGLGREHAEPGRARFAGFLLDNLEFGAPMRATEITEIARRVRESIHDLAVDILHKPAAVNELIKEWQESVKHPQAGKKGTVQQNASAIHRKSSTHGGAGRGDYESRVLALYRALDGEVLKKGEYAAADLRRVKATRAANAAITSVRIGDHLARLEQARLLLGVLIEEDMWVRNRVIDKDRPRTNLPASLQAQYMVEDGPQLTEGLYRAHEAIKMREAQYANPGADEKRWASSRKKKA